jgi:hypothetical protein
VDSVSACECVLMFCCYLLTGINNVVRFEVFTAVTMKNGVFWDATPCGSCKNRWSGGNLTPPSSG